MMPAFSRISCQQAQQLIDAGSCQIVDIRDAASFQRSHVSGSLELNNDNLAKFLSEADIALPLLVFCYHGNSSQSAAQFLAEQSFKEVYSVDGGFEQWALLYPDRVERG